MAEWISHRGICDHEKYGACGENSYKSFAIARDLGFAWLETDLRVCRDGHLVLSHDRDLRRCFRSRSFVEQVTAADLKSLKSPLGDGILFFEDFISHFSALSWVLDIKPETEAQVVAALSCEPMRSLIQARLARTKFLFWTKKAQASFLQVFPNADCFAQERECWRAGIAAISGWASLGNIEAGKTYALPPELAGLDLYHHRIMDAFHRRGAKILAYLPSKRQDAERAIAGGASYVLANSALF